MKRIIARFAYRFLLRLHPASFRYDFGDEMLWIFDEEPRRGRLPALGWSALSATPALQVAE